MATEGPAAPPLRDRDSIPERFKWNLKNIFPTWDEWQAAYTELDRKIDAFAALQGTLGQGSERLLASLRLREVFGCTAHNETIPMLLKRERASGVA